MWENEDGAIDSSSNRVAFITESGTVQGSGGVEQRDSDYWNSIGSPVDEYVYVSWDLSEIDSWTHKNIKALEIQFWAIDLSITYDIHSLIIHNKNENPFEDSFYL